MICIYYPQIQKKILDSRLGNDFEADKIGEILSSKR